MEDIKVKEERGKAELPKLVRHVPKEFVRRGLAAAKEKGVVQLMQAAQNGTGNSADTEDGMRPDAQTVVDSGVGLVEDTARRRQRTAAPCCRPGKSSSNGMNTEKP